MNNLCRVCLNRDNLISIFESHDEVPFSRKIMSVASVKISADDKLSHSICSSCVSRLHDCYSFKLDCERSDLKQRSRLTEISSHEKPTSSRNILNQNNSRTSCNHITSITGQKLNKKIKRDISADDNHQTEKPITESESSEAAADDTNRDVELFTEAKLKSNYPSEQIKKSQHKKAQCFTCGRVMSSRFRLKMHMRIHTGEKPFTCNYCDKTFSLAHSLKVHERVHTGEKPLHCMTCGKTFAQYGGLVTHQRLHTGQMPYRCTLCTASFRTSGHLQYHIRWHTGEKNFECDTCHRAFITRSDLKQHSRTHTGDRPYVCCVCGLRLSRASHLKRHMAVHEVPRPFSCAVCNTTFQQEVEFERHKKTHTSAVDPVEKNG